MITSNVQVISEWSSDPVNEESCGSDTYFLYIILNSRYIIKLFDK